MTRLRNSDLQAVVEFLGEASSVDGPDPFPRPLLDSLRRLVPSDEVVYDELDRVRETVLWEEIFPGGTDGPDEPTYWDVRDQHPVCRHHEVRVTSTP